MFVLKYHGFLHSIPTESIKRFKSSTSSNMRSSESPYEHLLIFVKPADNNSYFNELKSHIERCLLLPSQDLKNSKKDFGLVVTPKEVLFIKVTADNGSVEDM